MVVRRDLDLPTVSGLRLASSQRAHPAHFSPRPIGLPPVDDLFRVPIAVPLLEQATRLEFGGGITAKVNSSLSFYAQGGYQFAVGDTAGGERQGVSGDLGLRINW